MKTIELSETKKINSLSELPKQAKYLYSDFKKDETIDIYAWYSPNGVIYYSYSN